jgi:hypothetical protein
MNRVIDLIAHAQAIQYGTLAGIDRAFGGKGKAFEAYRDALLEGQKGETAKGMSDAAKKFFGDGFGGVIPTRRVLAPPRAKEEAK